MKKMLRYVMKSHSLLTVLGYKIIELCSLHPEFTMLVIEMLIHLVIDDLSQ
jgi:hypothetical protein